MRQMKRKIKRLLIFFLIISFGVGAPSLFKNNSDASENIDEPEVTNSMDSSGLIIEEYDSISNEISTLINKNLDDEIEDSDGNFEESEPDTFSTDSIPEYSGDISVAINDNNPFFTADEFITTPFETYSSLDNFGRCNVAYANVCKELMPTEKRGNIGNVRPTGWHTVKYAGIDGNYLYNRCHLIGYQLTGENANEKNLITGTRYFNVQGMEPYETDVAQYVKRTGHHVLYRVTPVFEGNNLLADGVLMEAASVEDETIRFCVFVYNVQPGIEIDYSNGNSFGPEYTGNK